MLTAVNSGTVCVEGRRKCVKRCGCTSVCVRVWVLPMCENVDVQVSMIVRMCVHDCMCECAGACTFVHEHVCMHVPVCISPHQRLSSRSKCTDHNSCESTLQLGLNAYCLVDLVHTDLCCDIPIYFQVSVTLAVLRQQSVSPTWS